MRLPVRVRLTLASAVVLTLILSATGAFLYLRLGADLSASIDGNLRSRADAIVAGIGDRDIAFDEAGAGFAPEVLFAQILDGEGKILESTRSVQDAPLLSPGEAAGFSRPAFLDRSAAVHDKGAARLFVLPVDQNDNRLLVVVGSLLEERDEALDRLLVLLLVGGPVALLAASAMEWFLAGAALRPVEHMRIEADAIALSERDRRLPVADTRDEIARLATTLNAMLDRLQEAFERERRFVDDASHELRTPLAILRSELDLALRHSRSVEELETAIASAAEETERLSRLAEDLLVLARANRGKLPVHRVQVSIDDFVREVAETFKGPAELAGVALGVEAPARTVSLDPDRVRQAVGNLLGNAIRHSPRGGQIGLVVTKRADEVVIEVWDSGEGFPKDFVARAFEPFARASSQGADSGAGLGLTIVDAVARAHGGRTVVSNDVRGGARVTMTFPA